MIEQSSTKKRKKKLNMNLDEPTGIQNEDMKLLKEKAVVQEIEDGDDSLSTNECEGIWGVKCGPSTETKGSKKKKRSKP